MGSVGSRGARLHLHSCYIIHITHIAKAWSPQSSKRRSLQSLCTTSSANVLKHEDQAVHSEYRPWKVLCVLTLIVHKDDAICGFQAQYAGLVTSPVRAICNCRFSIMMIAKLYRQLTFESPDAKIEGGRCSINGKYSALISAPDTYNIALTERPVVSCVYARCFIIMASSLSGGTTVSIWVI